MPAPLPVGSNINGFIVVSTTRQEGRIRVRCPACYKAVWKYSSNLKRSKSCGCVHAKGISQAKRLERHRALVERALVAFGTDFRYGEAMARAAMRIRERGRDGSATL